MKLLFFFLLVLPLCIARSQRRREQPPVRLFYNSPNVPSVDDFPYSHAVIAGGRWVFVSAQQGIDAKTGAVPTGGVKAEAKQALNNIFTVLQEVGARKSQIMKLTNYLKNIKDLPEVNEAYKEVFEKGKYPARASFQVAALPAAGNLEIDAVAVIDPRA